MKLAVIAIILAVAGCGGMDGVSPCDEFSEVWDDGISHACMEMDCCLCDCWHADHYVPDPLAEDGLCVCIPPGHVECTDAMAEAVQDCLDNPACVDSHFDSAVGLVLAECG